MPFKKSNSYKPWTYIPTRPQLAIVAEKAITETSFMFNYHFIYYGPNEVMLFILLFQVYQIIEIMDVLNSSILDKTIDKIKIM